MLVSLILAQIWVLNNQYKINPIILLDEVFTHFDEQKKVQLANEIENLNGQFFITTTEQDLTKLFVTNTGQIIICS